ncbi:MAG: hypothetical protein J7502_09415 [Flavisolibacter sp.]|nr:hypothetical protein [Flavisolibacter sp.]
MKLTERMKAPCPPFFKKLRTIGVVVAAAAGALLTAPVSLPLIVLKIAGYAAVAGGVATAVSQATACSDETGGSDAGE